MFSMSSGHNAIAMVDGDLLRWLVDVTETEVLRFN